jgi:hypothetical protein
LLLKKLLKNIGELVDKHCGRLRYDFHQRLQEIARDFRQTGLAKIDATTQGLRQALDRALTQKQSSAQAAADRMGQLVQRLTEILQAESKLFALKERIENTLT